MSCVTLHLLLTSLGLSFLNCKMGVMIFKAVVMIKLVNTYKCTESSLTHPKSDISIKLF